MAKIKGRYVGTITMEFEFDKDKIDNPRPFEEMKKMFHNEISKDIEEALRSEICSEQDGKLTVTEIESDIWEE